MKKLLNKPTAGELKIFQATALQAAKLAGQALQTDYKNHHRLKAHLKNHRDLVTSSDLKSEKLIINKIKESFPDHQILAEESGLSRPDQPDYLWIIDPLDGTTNFYIHSPLWAVSIALAHKGKIIIGVIYAPYLQEVYWAVAGQGAYLNGRKLTIKKLNTRTNKKIIHAFCQGSKKSDIKRAIKYYQKQKLSSLECRQMGSAAIEAAYVAAGRLASLLIPGTSPWDVAAGALIVKEAGGRVSDFQGRDWKILNRDFLATGTANHQALLTTIKKIKI